MEKWTSSPSAATEHLEPEVLASFLDGRLREDENRRVRRHLAECEDCNLAFVATVGFLREEERREAVEQGNVLPFSEPLSPVPAKGGRKEWGWRFAVAATVVLAVGAGFLGYQAFEAPGMGATDVPVERLEGLDSVRSGSGQLEDRKTAFALGAQYAALRATAAQGGDTSQLVEDMSSILAQDPSLRKLRVDPEDRDLAADLRHELGAPQWFELGEWAVVGKAACRAEREDLLRGSWQGFRFGRLEARLLKEESGAFDESTRERLRKIASLRDAPELDFAALEKEFDALLAAR